MRRLLLLWAMTVTVGGCVFDGSGPGGVSYELGAGDLTLDGRLDLGDLRVDAGADAGADTPHDSRDGAPPELSESDGGPDLPLVCTPGSPYCAGRVRQVCKADGSGPEPGQSQTCDFTCAKGTCVFASNLPPTSYASCGPGAPALAPPTDATVRLVNDDGTRRIECSPSCGVGSTIEASAAIDQGGGPTIALFCLSVITLPASVEVTVEGGFGRAVALFSHGAVTISGAIDVSGGDGGENSAGAAGPGGARGGHRSAGAGDEGEGACGGDGGQRSGSSGQRAAGGGGGGGHAGHGGAGGRGRSPNGNYTADGGAGGGLTPCGAPDLVPLSGGGGGGGGADGTCGADCGWPGGGGGGAIQIVSRASISVTGAIRAAGGAGYGVTSSCGACGGGGGGAGGAILLEAPAVSVSGVGLCVEGGAGGQSHAGAGGAGAAGLLLDGAPGASETGDGEGGAGGGGGAGRVRLNSKALLLCSGTTSPDNACGSGTLSTTAP